MNKAISIYIYFFSIVFLAACSSIITNEQRNNGQLIYKDGLPYSGPASFKFAIVYQEQTLWSHDGTSEFGAEPETFVEMQVTDGQFDLALGEEPQMAIVPELFELFDHAELVIWVNTGSGFEEFSKIPVEGEKITVIEPEPVPPPPVMYNEEVMDEKVSRKEQKLERKDQKQKAGHPGGLMEQRVAMRRSEDGTIPLNALVEAKQHIDQMPQSRDAGIWNWTWLGPGNIGGRIRTIAINPSNTNIILVGAVSGGIWRSTNGGSSWSPMNDFMASLAVTSIVFDPTNSNIVYAATGEGFYNSDALPGAGIFKSTNGGISWTQLSSTNNANFRWVNRLDHHPGNANILYAATRDPHRVWKTLDGGITWTQMLTSSSAVFDVKVHPNLPQYVIAGCANNVYLSSNSGSSWTHQTTGATNKLPNNPERCEVSFCASNNGRIYVAMELNEGEVWRSNDYGATWSQRSSTGYMASQGWYNNAIWVCPSNSDYIIVGGIDLFRSTNGGTSFTKISRWQNYHNGGPANSAHADQHIIISPPDFHLTDNPVVYVGNDGGIQKMNDFWTVSETSGWVNLCGVTLGIVQFYGGAAAPDGSVIVGGTQDNDKLRYRPSGSWSGTAGWYQAHTGDGGFSAVNYNNTSIIYGEYVRLVIKKSTNGGDSYSNAISGLSDAGTSRALFIAPFSMDPNDPTRLIAGGKSIWRTTNSAGSWTRIRDSISGNFPKCSAIDIADGNSGLIWVGYQDGHVAYTTGGTTTNPSWTRVDNSSPGLPNRYVTDIAINPFNHQEVFVTFGGYELNSVWFTSNSGASWEQRTGTAPDNLPALQVNTVRFHYASSNWVYIGTDLGVFASENKGISWSLEPRYTLVGHEGPVNTEVSELFWQGDNLIAATYGRGMYRATPRVDLYVDWSAPSGGNGSFSQPYQTVTQGVNNAGPGTNIWIKAGNYNETGQVLFNKRGMVRVTNNTGTVVIY
ncbi:MAG: hypothetical protein R6W71_10600 [Bacteroidales bacterium]